MRSFVLSAAVFVSVVAVLTGCGSGPKRYKATGTVSYKGTPIPLGTVTFIPEGSGAPAGGATIKDGKFEIPATPGIPEGKYKVSISYPDPKGQAPTPKDGEAPGESREVKEQLPAKYNTATELTAEVKGGEANDFTFDLK